MAMISGGNTRSLCFLELDLAGRDRAALSDDAQHVGDERLLVPREPSHPAPRIFRGISHAEPKHRLEIDRQERRFVTPVLEQRTRWIKCERVERIAIVSAEPRERGQVVRARQHVDRIDLDHAELFGERAQHRLRHRLRTRTGELLRRDRECTRLDQRHRVACGCRLLHACADGG
jgi:hypothetical protein